MLEVVLEDATSEGAVEAGSNCTWLDFVEPIFSQIAAWLFKQLLPALVLEKELVLEVGERDTLAEVVEAGSGCTWLVLLDPVRRQYAGWPWEAEALRLRSTFLGKEPPACSYVRKHV